MKMFAEPARRIPVYAEVGVLVIGGGPAGTAAAIAAARQGADTLLVESQAFLGGGLTASLMSVISGFRNQKQPNATQAVRGIPQEIVCELHRMRGLAASPVEQQEFDLAAGQLSYSYAVDAEKLKVLLIRMAGNALCDVLLHTAASWPITDGNRVTGAIVENKSGRQAILAMAVVDCTGDADIAHRSGALCVKVAREPEAALPHLVYKVAGFKPRLGVPLPGILVNASLLVMGPAIAADGTNGIDVSRGEIEARTQVLEHFEQIRQAYPCLAGAFVAETPAALGFGRSRYVQGEYTLTEHDALSGARFTDVVAISAAPVLECCGETRCLDHEGFDVPYRCLVPAKIDGLLVAGRCVSCEQLPFRSLGSAACTMAMGQAAGTAAAIAARKNILPRQLNVSELRQALIAQGAEVRQSF